MPLRLHPWKPYSQVHQDNRVSILQNRPAVFQMNGYAKVLWWVNKVTCVLLTKELCNYFY